jgi:glc operon protein GlcG
MSLFNLKNKKELSMTQKFIRTSFAAAAALVLIPLAALPQAAPPVIPYGVSVTADVAKKAAAAAIVEAKKDGLQMAVAIVDTAGYLVYFERMPDTQLASVEIAIGKAKSATLFRRPTKVFQDGVAAGGVGIRFLGLTGAVPVEGGVPLIVNGKVIGAIGASGGTSDQDGMVANAGAAPINAK